MRPTVPVQTRSLTVAEFKRGLAGVLHRLLVDDGRWILVASIVGSENLYVQFHCDEDGELHAEVVSNNCLSGDERLSDAQTMALTDSGWEHPVGDGLPNFWRRGDLTSVETVASETLIVLREVFGLGDDGLLLARMFRSPLDPLLVEPVSMPDSEVRVLD